VRRTASCYPRATDGSGEVGQGAAFKLRPERVGLFHFGVETHPWGRGPKYGTLVAVRRVDVGTRHHLVIDVDLERIDDQGRVAAIGKRASSHCGGTTS
jgi:hypothetical protein